MRGVLRCPYLIAGVDLLMSGGFFNERRFCVTALVVSLIRGGGVSAEVAGAEVVDAGEFMAAGA